MSLGEELLALLLAYLVVVAIRFGNDIYFIKKQKVPYKLKYLSQTFNIFADSIEHIAKDNQIDLHNEALKRELKTPQQLHNHLKYYDNIIKKAQQNKHKITKFY